MDKDFLEIRPGRPENVTIRVPGSKSESHRYLVAAALAEGVSVIENVLMSEDVLFTINGLCALGIHVEKLADGVFRVHGKGGKITGAPCEIFLGNSGTSVRLLSAVAALGEEASLLDGTCRMRERPIAELLDALAQIRIPAASVLATGCPPVIVGGGSQKGGKVRLSCAVSSQYLSGLLLIAPCLEKGLFIEVEGESVSKPYMDMTLRMMDQMGISFSREAYRSFHIPGKQAYFPDSYRVAADASSASYFFAAAAITGGSVFVEGISRESFQGDAAFPSLLEKMGCFVENRENGVFIRGGDLNALDADMADMPDMVPGLAVVAAFAKGRTRLRNLSHLRIKESDRLNAVAEELKKMGARVQVLGDDLEIEGGYPLHGASVRTYEDHRMAMAFSVAGLRVPGVFIENPGCVVKSFPNFFDVFSQLTGGR